MELARQLAAVMFVLALAGGMAWRLRRQAGGRPRFRLFGLVGAGGQGGIEEQGRLRLSPQHTLHLVRAGGRSLLVACHPAGLRLLAELPNGENPGAGGTAADSGISTQDFHVDGPARTAGSGGAQGLPAALPGEVL